LEHIVEPDAHSTSKDDGNESKDECNKVNAKGEGFEHGVHKRLNRKRIAQL